MNGAPNQDHLSSVSVLYVVFITELVHSAFVRFRRAVVRYDLRLNRRVEDPHTDPTKEYRQFPLIKEL